MSFNNLNFEFKSITSDKKNNDEEFCEFGGRQVNIFCHLCKSWQTLTKKAADALPENAINFVNFCCVGRCMRAVCNEQFEKKEKEKEYWRKLDERCDAMEAKYNANRKEYFKQNIEEEDF
jgi:hypothetical protein